MQVQKEYDQVICSKYPEGVAIAIAKDAGGKCNPITLGWTMITSHKPPMFAIAVSLGHYSRQVIEEAGEFVLSFPSGHMAEAALYYGTNSGRDVDKFKEFPVKTERASEVDCVILADACANFECKLESQMVTGDHMLFVGKVVASHINKDQDVGRLYTWAKGYKMGEAKLKK